MDIFRYAEQNSSIPLCYNGNLCTIAQIEQFSMEHSAIQAVMLGRGLIGNPGMLTPGGTERQTLTSFLEQLLEAYTIAFGGSRNAMFRLKENWRYLFCLFQPDPKLQKRLRKATDLAEYKAVTAEILRNLPMQKELSSDW